MAWHWCCHIFFIIVFIYSLLAVQYPLGPVFNEFCTSSLSFTVVDVSSREDIFFQYIACSYLITSDLSTTLL